MLEKKTFTAKIEEAGGGGAYVRVPFDVEKAFGSKRPKVKAMIEGVPYRGTLVRMGADHHILGVLKEQPMHGYELRHYLSFIVGHIWQLSYGTLYPALRRLEKRGDLTKQTIRDGKGPAKHVYGLTPQGEKAFLAQMAAISSPTRIKPSASRHDTYGDVRWMRSSR